MLNFPFGVFVFVVLFVPVVVVVTVVVFAMHWNATNASYELFCVILVILGLDLVLVVLVGRAAAVDDPSTVVDDCLATLVILEMEG